VLFNIENAGFFGGAVGSGVAFGFRSSFTVGLGNGVVVTVGSGVR
jgi:hypothetical protein